MGGKGRTGRRTPTIPLDPSSPSSLSSPFRAMLIDRVLQFVLQHNLIRSEARVLAAVSGGSDSVALVHILRALDAAGVLRLAGLVHFNHQLRAAADDDERFVVRLGESMVLPVVTDRGDIAGRARRERRSVEDAARAARYEFFERAREAAGADLIALGHTRDDQAETFLLRLVRGAGPRGLAGMHPRAGIIVRPLLDCRRAELRAFLAARAIAFVEDETNRDVAIPRNRVRAELLPLLQDRFNPGIVDVLADEAALARDVWAWQEALAADAAAQVVRSPAAAGRDAVREIDVAALIALPLALRRAVLWRVMNELAGGRPIGFGHVDAAIRLIDRHANGRVDLPGQRLERIGPRLVLTGRSIGAVGRTVATEPNLFHYPLSIPGEVALPEAGCCVSVEAPGAAAARAVVSNPAGASAAVVRGDLCGQTLSVRNRRPGDRFRPVGLGGRKKLQDYFVDRKVARELRATVPIVVDGMDRIVWVAGYEIDEAFRVTDPAQAVLILKLRQV
jgi:tRNA(Ile)-lysidine synthase